MQTKIVLISVNNENSKEVANKLKGSNFKNIGQLHEFLIDKLVTSENEANYVIFSLDEFVDEVNDGILDVLTNDHIAHVIIEK